jgi:uncharacterized protein (TIGR02118 family)
MIKMIVMVTKKPGISSKEFYKYWSEHHGPLVAKHMPGIRKYIQNHLVPVPGEGGENPEGDGFIEVWFDNVQAYHKFLEYGKSEQAKKLGLGSDWAKIADQKPPKVWIVEEHLIKDFE